MAKRGGPSSDNTFVFPDSSVSRAIRDDFPPESFKTEIDPRTGRRDTYFAVPFGTAEEQAQAKALLAKWNAAFAEKYPYAISDDTLPKKAFLDKLGAEYLVGPEGWSRVFTDTPERLAAGAKPAKERYEAALEVLEGPPTLVDEHAKLVAKQLTALGGAQLTREGTAAEPPAWFIGPDATLDPVEWGQRVDAAHTLVYERYQLVGRGAALQAQQKIAIIELGLSQDVFGIQATSLADLDHVGDITVTGALKKANELYAARLVRYEEERARVPIDEVALASHASGLLFDRDRGPDREGFDRVFRTITAAAAQSIGKERTNQIGADTLITQTTQAELEVRGRSQASRDAREQTGGYVVDEDIKRLARDLTGTGDTLAESIRELSALQESLGVEASKLQVIRAEPAFVAIGPIVAADERVIVQQVETLRDGERTFAYAVHERDRIVSAVLKDSVSIGHLITDQTKRALVEEAITSKRPIAVGEVHNVRFALSITRIRENDPSWDTRTLASKQSAAISLLRTEYEAARTQAPLALERALQAPRRDALPENERLAIAKTIENARTVIEAVQNATIVASRSGGNATAAAIGDVAASPSATSRVSEIRVRGAAEPLFGRIDDIRGKAIAVALQRHVVENGITKGIDTGAFVIINRNDSRDAFAHRPLIAQSWKNKGISVTVGFTDAGALVVQPGVKSALEINSLGELFAKALPAELEKSRQEAAAKTTKTSVYDPDLHRVEGHLESEQKERTKALVESVALTVARERGIDVSKILFERQQVNPDYQVRRVLNDNNIVTKVARITNNPSQDGIAIVDFGDIKKLDGLVRHVDHAQIIVSHFDKRTNVSRIYVLENFGAAAIRDSERIVYGGDKRPVKVGDVIEFRETGVDERGQREFAIEVVDKAVSFKADAIAEAHRRKVESFGEIELDEQQRNVVSAIIAGGLKKAGYNIKSVELLEKDHNGIIEGTVRPITYKGNRLVVIVQNEDTYHRSGNVRVWEFRDPKVVDSVFGETKELTETDRIFARGEAGNEDLASRVFSKDARGEFPEAGRLGKVVIRDNHVHSFTSTSAIEIKLAAAARAEIEKIRTAAQLDTVEQESTQQHSR
jgi:hypothetical protein